MLSDKILKSIKCSSCGGELEIKNPRTKYVTCQYCGTTTDLNGLTKDIKKGNPDSFKPISFLKLGMIGEFDKIAYQVVGRTSWKNEYQEYDTTDRCYYAEKWYFDEWLLLSDEGNYMTIIEDKEGYSISSTITPTYPNLGKDNYLLNFYSENRQQMSEYGKSIIQYFEGESTYLITIGSYSDFAQYETDSSYIVEWRKKNDELFEIEFFREESISKRELIEAFKQNEEIEAVYEEVVADKKASLLRKRVFLAFGLINLVVAISFSYKSSSFKTLLFRKVTLHQNNWSVLNDTMLYAEGVFDTILAIPAKANTISYFTSSNFPKDSLELVSYMYLLGDKSDTLSTFKNYFYSYHTNVSEASQTQKLVELSPPKEAKNFKIALRFEMPKRCLTRSAGTTISYLFQDEGRDYNSSFIYVLAFFFLYIGYKMKVK